MNLGFFCKNVGVMKTMPTVNNYIVLMMQVSFVGIWVSFAEITVYGKQCLQFITTLFFIVRR